MKLFVDLVAMAWMILLAGGVVLWVRGRRRRGPALIAVALAGSLIEAAALPSRLLALLERPYLEAAAAPQAGDAIVVLGGGMAAPSPGVLEVDLNESGDRLMTAVELARRGLAGEIVLGGGGRGNPKVPYEGEYSKAWIERWKLFPGPVTVLPPSRNTHDEALHTAELARQRGWKTVCLVTSAWHMARAREVFEKTGLRVIPAPCDFRGTTALRTRDRIGFVPGTGSVVDFNCWLREVLGRAVYQLRGWA